ncbi:MAG: HAMP domain-containing histidine kinase [Clostridia bacterium]|nr:HAMP domain-containing histidine kinase [Clostridia bacterium]
MISKLKLNKLRNRIWIYFVIFTVLLVSLIWLLQTVFFEYNYQKVKGETMNAYADIISNEYTSSGEIREEHVLTLKDSGVSVSLVYSMQGEIGFIYPSSVKYNEDNPYHVAILSVIEEMNVKNLAQYTGEGSFAGSIIVFTAREISTFQGTRYLILSSGASYAQDAVNVLREQLLLVAVVVTSISLFISYLISNSISKPINDMSAVAEKWAKGDDEVVFTSGTYAEMDELANALNKAKVEVNKTGKLQKDLLANVSHDLKTPLTMIKAYAEMIKDISGDNKEKRDKHTKVIIDESDRLTLLVNDILNLSKLQANAEELTVKCFNLSELVETVIYRFDDVMIEKGYTFEKSIEENVFVKGDEQKIEQAVYNLIGNAINYTGEDKTVKVFLTTENGIATLEIIDSGKGIDSEKLETIWEKYYRYSETHKRTVKGTGLGLSIVKAVFDIHELEYGVLSKEGLGTNFFVKFNVIVEGDKNE